MNNAKVVTTYQNESGTTVVKTEDIETDMSINIEAVIPAGATNMQFVVAIAYARLKAIGIGCKKVSGSSSESTNIVTVKTNSTSSPANTYNITPANGIGWSIGDTNFQANPVTTDVTTIYVSNSGTADSNFSMRIAIDSSP